MAEKQSRGRFRTIHMKMWADEKFQALSPLPPSGQSLWIYLLTGPHTGVIPGVFSAGRAGLAESLGWSMEAFGEAFGEVFQEGLIEVDWHARFVWIPKAILYNKPQSPNVILSWQKDWILLPECPLKVRVRDELEALVGGLGEAFGKAFGEAFDKPSGKPMAKSRAIAEQEQEQEQEGKPNPLTPTSSSPKTANVDRAIVGEVFAYWQQTMHSPRSILDDRRQRSIRAALAMGYNADQLCRAIHGCSLTPHNMGHNDRNQRYVGLDLILRDADHIDRFIEADAHPPATNGTARENMHHARRRTAEAFGVAPQATQANAGRSEIFDLPPEDCHVIERKH
jgi:hypothetical protein